RDLTSRVDLADDTVLRVGDVDGIVGRDRNTAWLVEQTGGCRSVEVSRLPSNARIRRDGRWGLRKVHKCDAVVVHIRYKDMVVVVGIDCQVSRKRERGIESPDHRLLTVHPTHRNRVIEIMVRGDGAIRDLSSECLDATVHIQEKQLAVHSDTVETWSIKVSCKGRKARQADVILLAVEMPLSLLSRGA